MTDRVSQAPDRLPVLASVWQDARLLWRGLRGTLRRRRWLAAACTSAFLLVVGLGLHPQDATLLRVVQLRQTADKQVRAELSRWAEALSDFGDFPGVLACLVALWIGGRWCKSRHYQRLAVAALMSAMLAGVVANISRSTTGRPRPRTIEREHVQDGFYGPRLRANYHSFPSAHTSTAFGAAIPLAVAAPVLGVPALAAAGSIAWARMYGNHHHPSDVAVAIWVATFYGVPLGLAVRRLRSTGAAGDGKGPLPGA
ncbi:MAG: phosphatase PAP2 family protein [Roseimicrobium sp.]